MNPADSKKQLFTTLTDNDYQTIIKQLNGTDTYIRPVHCSDLKREILYIKNDDEWKKETEDNIEIKKAIKEPFLFKLYWKIYHLFCFEKVFSKIIIKWKDLNL